MPKTLTPAEEKLRKELLDIVLRVAGTDKNKIRGGIIAALKAKGELGQGYRTTLLWGDLARKATAKIQKAKKEAEARQPSLV